MRTRIENESNYKAIFIDGKTIRLALDSDKDITELKYPEFYDISLGNKCVTGKCKYCYASGNPNGKRYTNIVEKAKNFFGNMELNQRPFQVAIGGESEPLEHKDFWDFCEYLLKLEIVPNYTTNGVLINKPNIKKTKEFCGGAALTYHAHLERYFYKAAELLIENNIKLNFHLIISDEKSIDLFKKIYEQFNNQIEYFVLLPYMNVGFARNYPKTVLYDYLESFLDEIYENGNIAFGANFYEFLKARGQKYDVSLYPPEIMSKYLIMDDEMGIYNNSFDCKKVGEAKNGFIHYNEK